MQRTVKARTLIFLAAATAADFAITDDIFDILFRKTYLRFDVDAFISRYTELSLVAE